jgi:ubiquinone/menaquinone biosynthesis C-methylase UbiE
MKIKDHFLSQEIFEVKASKHAGILRTYPQPSLEELPKYYESDDYISHQTESKSIKDFVYQKVKSLMLHKKKQWILRHNTSGKILDIGAGTGDFLNVFEKKLWKKYAIEPSGKLQEVLKEKDISVVNDLKEFKDQSLDVITLWHSLEHIPDLEHTLSELRRVIKNEGIIFIAVPNYESYDAKYYKKFWAAWDVPRHLWHFSRKGFKRLVQQYSLKCDKEKGLYFDAFYVSLLSEKYKPKGSYFRSIPVGWYSNFVAKQNKEYSSVLYVLKPFDNS